MLNRLPKKVNDKGSTLVMAIVVISFVSIMVSLILIISGNNIVMKTTEKKSKNNFYSAEAAMEVIENGLQRDMAESMSKAYYHVLSKYDYTETDTIRNDEYKNYVINDAHNGFIDKIVKKDAAGVRTDGIVSIENLKSYIDSSSDFDGYNITVEGLLDDGSSKVIKYVYELNLNDDEKNAVVTIAGLKVSLSNSEGYSNAISTDLNICVPKPDFSINRTANISQAFMEYGIIANLVYTSGGINSNKIKGDLWTKAGVLIDGEKSRLSVYGNNFFAGSGNVNSTFAGLHPSTEFGGVVVKDGVSKEISTNFVFAAYDSSDPDANTSNVGSIYADKLMVDNVNIPSNSIVSNAAGGYNSLNLDIDGRCVIKDDLILNSPYSNVNIKGQYYGFGRNDMNALASSSIILNGKYSTLNMVDLSTIMLAGRAFISADKYELDGGNIRKTADVFILTGESISLRGSQDAYLVPVSCMNFELNDTNGNPVVAFTSNPVSEKKYIEYRNALYPDMADSSSKELEYQEDIEEAIVDKLENSAYADVITGKLDDTKPIITVYYKPFDDLNARYIYYYLNFKNLKNATDYYNKLKANGEIDDSYYANMIPMNSVNISATNFLTNGNYLTDTSGILTQGTTASVDINTSTWENKYKGILSSFSADSVVSEEMGNLTDDKYAINSQIKWSTVEGLSSPEEYTYESYKGVVTNEDYVIDSEFNGLLLTSGNVTINANVNGLIIAKGVVTHSSGYTVKAEPSIVADLFKTTNIKKYFLFYKEEELKGKSDIISLKDMIKYINWRKE